jgi:hypothetical protein
MTFRGIILGLAAASIIASVGYVNNQIIQITPVASDHFPVIVFGPLLLVLIVANPALKLLRPSWRLKPSELAVAVTLAFAGCAIPGSGMLRFFTRVLAVPVIANRTEPGWKKTEVLSYVPPPMLPGGGQYGEGLDESLLYGQGHFIQLGDVPWGVWEQPLTTWLPMIVLLSAASICLALIVHRQWSWHERLRYPIVEFTGMLLQEESSKVILRQKVFWIALVAVVAIRAVNWIQMWFPQSIEIPLTFNLLPVAEKYQVLDSVPWSYELLRPTLWPIIMAFAFFLASDVALSLPLSVLIFTAASVICLEHGISADSDRIRGGIFDWLRFGGCAAFVLMLAYTGRRYYWQVLRSAVAFVSPKDRVDGYAVWACRILLLCLAGVVVMLARLGLSWVFAAAAVSLIMVLFLVVARLNAEAGLILVMMNIQPVGIILALMGATALGPKALVVVGLATLVLAADTRACLLPYIVNGVRLCDDQKVRPSRVGYAAIGAFVLALAVAVPVALWTDYSFGTNNRTDGFACYRVPRWVFNTASQEISKLSAFNLLEKSQNLSSGERIAQLSPNPTFLWMAGTGAVLVVAVSAMRLRFTWWPLHPIVFVVIGSLTTVQFAFSFLIGWAIKRAVTAFAGPKTYKTTKVFMVGVIAGETLGGFAFMIVVAVYYYFTGRTPR